MPEIDLGRLKVLAREMLTILEPVETQEWGPLGAEFWIRNGEAIGATRRQIRFAASLHMGSSQARAARTAGFACTLNGRGWASGGAVCQGAAVTGVG